MSVLQADLPFPQAAKAPLTLRLRPLSLRVPPTLRPPSFLQGPDTDPKVTQFIHQCIEHEEPCTVRLINQRKNGETFWNFIHLQPSRATDDGSLRYVGVQCDITSLVQRVGMEQLPTIFNVPLHVTRALVNGDRSMNSSTFTNEQGGGGGHQRAGPDNNGLGNRKRDESEDWCEDIHTEGLIKRIKFDPGSGITQASSGVSLLTEVKKKEPISGQWGTMTLSKADRVNDCAVAAPFLLQSQQLHHHQRDHQQQQHQYLHQQQAAIGSAPQLLNHALQVEGDLHTAHHYLHQQQAVIGTVPQVPSHVPKVEVINEQLVGETSLLDAQLLKQQYVQYGDGQVQPSSAAPIGGLNDFGPGMAPQPQWGRMTGQGRTDHGGSVAPLASVGREREYHR